MNQPDYGFKALMVVLRALMVITAAAGLVLLIALIAGLL